MTKGNIDAFLKVLFAREAGDNSKIINYAGYIGKYQFGESALVDLGYYAADNTLQNDWKGKWKGKHGVNSRSDFLNSETAQDVAAKEWIALLCKRMRKLGLDLYIGSVVKGVMITDSGIIAGAHLKGFGTDKHPGVKHFLKSNGEIDPEDGLKTSVSKYVSQFGGYDVGCCKKVTMAFSEKKTGTPIVGLKVQVTKNGKIHNTGNTDENGLIKTLHSFNSGDKFEILVEKISGGVKRLKASVVDEADVTLAFLSPKAKLVATTETHKGEPKELAKNPALATSEKTATRVTSDYLDKASATWQYVAKPAPKRDNTVEKTRNINGHPTIVVKKNTPTLSPSPVMAMQKTIPGLLFPFEKRPKESYKDGARRFGSHRTATRKHAGIDLYAPVGTPVRAMADGVVLQIYPFYAETWVVEVDHTTFIARYGEIEEDGILVIPKEKIKRGQKIGQVGKLKGLNISMLHLELYATTENPTEKGKGLTQKNNAPFERRDDLINPTDSIDLAVLE